MKKCAFMLLQKCGKSFCNTAKGRHPAGRPEPICAGIGTLAWYRDGERVGMGSEMATTGGNGYIQPESGWNWLVVLAHNTSYPPPKSGSMHGSLQTCTNNIIGTGPS